MLTEVIKKQSLCLEFLNLSKNFFSEFHTEKLLFEIKEYPFDSLQVLDLYKSANFGTDESVRYLT